ncbi:hypothetical protein DZB84_00005 [Bacillus sp. HNG]|nr:hypothetical protein DZB84_00005 [Bacillus sp. HNG]
MKDENEYAFEYLINEFSKQGIVLTDIEEYNRQEHSKANDNSYIKYDGFLSVVSALDDKPSLSRRF